MKSQAVHTLLLRAHRALLTGLSCCILGFTPGATRAAVGDGAVLVPTTGSTWKYLDDGVTPPATWRGAGFADAAWAAGPAPLGYGEAGLGTTVGFGADPDNKHVTTYFRQTFAVPNATLFNRMFLNLRRDDGAVVYLNGSEVFRNNLPAGVIDARTLAVTNVYGAGEGVFHSVTLNSTGLLLNGANVLAVEVHQAGHDSIDLNFDLSLSASNLPQVTRGPYLQKGTPTSVLVRWRTATPTDSRVQFGRALGNLNQTAEDATLTTNHQVTLTGLLPDSRYFYTIGSTVFSLAGGADHSFVTAPTVAKPTRVWVIGDAGTATANQRAVRDAYYNYAGNRYTDVWLMLGDNAYGGGSESEYQNALFNIYPELLRQTVAWSCIGNHETYSTGDLNNFPYLNIFSPPVNGEAGGEPSGTKKYFSFDYGNIHFVSLDSMTVSRATGGAMYQWLERDLMANTKDWLIVFFHHPPYTKGSHDSDNGNTFDPELVQMRENFLPLLESYGVDLVLGGHSHIYERSYLLDGHYGYSASLNRATMIKNLGNGDPAGDGSYIKPTTGPQANQGAVYIVAGSAGQATFRTSPTNHPVMRVSLLKLGSLVLDVDGPTLNATFLRETGAVEDRFTIFKGEPASVLRVTNVTVEEGTVSVTWRSVPGQYYYVQSCSDVSAPEWDILSEGILATDISTTWSDYIDPFAPAAFYQIVNYLD